MMLSKKQYYIIKNTRDRIFSDSENVGEEDILEFLNTLTKTSDYNKKQISNYLKEVGFNSISEFQKHKTDKRKKEVIKGLAIVGGGLLIAYSLSKNNQKANNKVRNLKRHISQTT